MDKMDTLSSMIWRERLVAEKRVTDAAWNQAEATRWGPNFASAPRPRTTIQRVPQTARQHPGSRPGTGNQARPPLYNDPRAAGRSGAQTARNHYRPRAPITLHSMQSASPPLFRKRPWTADLVDMGLPPVDITFDLRIPPKAVTHPTHASGLSSGCEAIFTKAGPRRLCAITRWKESLVATKTQI